MTKNLELDRTTAFPSCNINGALMWSAELDWMCQRLWNLSLNNFDVFSAQEYDSFDEAKAALIEMYRSELFEADPPEPVYDLVNIDTGERVTGTINELKMKFKYTQLQPLRNLIDGYIPKSGRLKSWRLMPQ